MPIIYASTEQEISEKERRSSVFDGDFFVYGSRPSTVALSKYAANTIEQMLGAEPPSAQQRMSEAEFSILFNAALRNFRHSRPVMELVKSLVSDFGCDPNETYFSYPEITAITGQGFLAQGFGAPRHPHRDTWFAASPSQLHWWISLYERDGLSSLAFHPRYWNWPVANSSSDFQYLEGEGATELATDAVLGAAWNQPRPLETVTLHPEIRIATTAGGLIMFSAAQLYSVVPNESLKTYFVTHFQTVNESDLLHGTGALNHDARPRGTSLANLVRCSDLRPISPDIIRSAMERSPKPLPLAD